MVLSIASIKINGGRAPIRKTHVKLLLEQRHVEVAFLQDVRCGDTCLAEWQNTIRGSWFFSSFDCPRAGVAFWLSSKIPSDQIAFHGVMKGRLAFVVFRTEVRRSYFRILMSQVILREENIIFPFSIIV